MSLLGKYPYLNMVLDDLDADELATLKDMIDGESEFVTRSMYNTSNLLTDDDAISAVNLELSKKDGIITGWFLLNSFIQVFANRPELQMWKIGLTNHTFEKVNETFTATDLRQIINDKLIEKGEGVEVQADDIKSGTATSGQVLTADGDGGADWADSEGVSVTPLLSGQYQDFYDSEGSTYRASVAFVIDGDKQAKLQSAKMIIFTMNNSFILTPLAQSGDTLACQSFAYNDLGGSRIARVRFTFSNEGYFTVLFDAEFAQATYNNLTTKPGAAILIVK